MIGTLLVHCFYSYANTEEILREYWIKNFNDSSVSIGRRIQYADSLIKHASTQKERLSFLKQKGDVAYTIGNYPRAMEAYRILYKESSKALEDAERVHIIDRMTRCEYFMGNYDKSVAFAKEVFDTPKHDSLNYMNAKAYINISQVYIRFKRGNVAKDYLKKAWDYLMSLKNVPPEQKRNALKRIYLNLSGAEIILGNIEEANNYLEQAEKLFVRDDSPLNLYINKAIIYEMLQENEIADDYYHKLMDYKSREYNMGVALNNYAGFKLMNGEFDEALRLTDKNLPLLQELQMNHARSLLYIIRANIFAHKGDFRRAYHALDSARIVNDSLFALDKEQEILHLTSQFDKSASSRIQSKAVREIGKRNTIIILLTLFLAAAAGFLIILVVREKRQRKINSDLETDMETIKEKHDNEMKSTVEGNEQRDKELVQFALRFAHINEAIDDMLDFISEKNQLSENKIDFINSKLRELRRQDVSWESFKVYFGQVHESFFNNLLAVAPNLTQGEIRMSAFVSMNLTAKEIALLTNRSVRTVETMKYRLAKKLPIPEGISLYEYLRFLQ